MVNDYLKRRYVVLTAEENVKNVAKLIFIISEIWHDNI